jgi:hypothetical protein
VLIAALPSAAGKVKKLSLLGYKGAITFSQDEKGLQVNFPAEKFGEHAWTLKIEGITL